MSSSTIYQLFRSNHRCIDCLQWQRPRSGRSEPGWSSHQLFFKSGMIQGEPTNNLRLEQIRRRKAVFHSHHSLALGLLLATREGMSGSRYEMLHVLEIGSTWEMYFWNIHSTVTVSWVKLPIPLCIFLMKHHQKRSTDNPTQFQDSWGDVNPTHSDMNDVKQNPVLPSWIIHPGGLWMEIVAVGSFLVIYVDDENCQYHRLSHEATSIWLSNPIM